MTLDVQEHMVQTVAGPRRTWLLTPTEPRLVGTERLRELREEGYRSNPVDREILAVVRDLRGESQLIVFRAATDDGERRWSFAPDLSDEDARELGYHLVLDQLPTYDALVQAGVFALLHVEFGPREVDACQHGTQRALDELEQRSIPEVAADPSAAIRTQIHRWILHNLTFFFTLSLRDVTESVLARQLPLLESRVPHLRNLTESRRRSERPPSV